MRFTYGLSSLRLDLLVKMCEYPFPHKNNKYGKIEPLKDFRGMGWHRQNEKLIELVLFIILHQEIDDHIIPVGCIASHYALVENFYRHACLFCHFLN
jgi:hypothetical protein